MKVIVCDDYPVIVKSLIQDVNKIAPQAECVGFSDAHAVLNYIESHTVNVALLDIDMPEIDGLTLAGMIQKRCPDVNIIFVTGHPEFALEAHELYASSFLVKPVKLNALRSAFEHLRKPYAELDEDAAREFYNGRCNFGANLRRLRTQHGLSVQEFSEKLDVSAQTVYRWESNERYPDIVKFIAISKLFGVSAEALLL